MCLAIGEAANSDMFRALAYIGFFLNLFNLLPVVPLDGGRAMAAMAPWMWFVGLGAVVALLFIAPNPILLIILLFGGMETWRRWQARKTRSLEQAAYYRVSPRNRLLVGAVYIGLIVVLALGHDRGAHAQPRAATASARSSGCASRTPRSMSRLVSRSRSVWRLS